MSDIEEIPYIPETLILKRYSNDYLGTVITLVKLGTYQSAYYAKMDGTCSLIEHVSIKSIDDILAGNHYKFFTNIEDLHKRVEADLLNDIDHIKRYRETGKYFEDLK